MSRNFENSLKINHGILGIQNAPIFISSTIEIWCKNTQNDMLSKEEDMSKNVVPKPYPEILKTELDL